MRGYTGVACGAQNVTGTLGKSDHDGGGGVGARRVHIKSGSQRVQREGATEWLPFPIT